MLCFICFAPLSLSLSLILDHQVILLKLGQMRQLHHMSHFAREIYQTYCTIACRETDMGWLLELLEDIYSNEVKHCMKATLKAKKTIHVRHLDPCDLYACWQRKLGYLFQGYFIFCYLSTPSEGKVRPSECHSSSTTILHAKYDTHLHIWWKMSNKQTDTSGLISEANISTLNITRYT